VKRAIGPWNFGEVNPQQLLGRFNSFLKRVILRVNEVRDLGDVNRGISSTTTPRHSRHHRLARCAREGDRSYTRQMHFTRRGAQPVSPVPPVPTPAIWFGD
jgi:hypothetical protein